LLPLLLLLKPKTNWTSSLCNPFCCYSSPTWSPILVYSIRFPLSVSLFFVVCWCELFSAKACDFLILNLLMYEY
jgi:hypothetical protein